ncbi:hypothetical protein A2U01_0105512, partial [Trifolium medium]|nr:hypothetical protein [Trifolium medium]
MATACISIEGVCEITSRCNSLWRPLMKQSSKASLVNPVERLAK